MKKNKSFVFIIFLIATLVFSVAAICPSCGQSLGSETGQVAPSATTAANSAKPEANSKESSPIIHGVVPVKITAHTSETVDLEKWELFIEFWNVGMLGGKQYADAIANGVVTAKGVQTITVVYKGYFTGGPNGDIDLSVSSSISGVTGKAHLKLNDGKELISDEGEVLALDNPEAFIGWID